MSSRVRLLLVLFAVSPVAYFPFSEWISTTRYGTSLLLFGQIVYLLPLLAAILGVPALLVALFFARRRAEATFFLLVALVFIPMCISGIVLGHKVRRSGMDAFARRSQPLIAAIHQYEQDHAMPPPTLADLVPDYLPRVPATGMMAYPAYNYHVGPECDERFMGNAWAVSVFTPLGGINFDQMLYFPQQNYPAQGYGGSLERIHDWAYVHE